MKYVSILSGITLLVLFAFVLGMWSGHKDWFPNRVLMDTRAIWRSVSATGMILPRGSFRKRPEWAAGTRYVVSDPEKVSPGFLAITRTSTEANTYVVDLLDESGALVHSWPVDHSQMIEGGEENSFLHATAVLPDGSLLTTFNEAIGMGRIDACGKPIWIRDDQLYHHSVYPDEKGQGYWTWQSKSWAGGHDQRMLRFDTETGETLESIDIIQDVLSNHPDQWLSLIVPEGFQFQPDAEKRSIKDILHPNDVEPLPVALVEAFPMFEAGDLLVSLRNINLVAVIDRKTHEILWARYGPWRDQHDADWHSDGTITVFSNNNGWGRSNIIELDLKTNDVRDLFHGAGFKFDSFIMGQHQQLPNGNWLIVSSMEGRVIEVSASGEPVREFNNYLNEKYNKIVSHAEVLAPDYFDTFPQCVH